ncbi:NAD-dependent epimerase/dehydratase family protein [Rhodococcus sp. IEGM 1408]|uniref:NAD-dependent epimerase/dehydratase family protein n=1 Tax=Rhodococcus sp. IEGM 1408 TaxID=3082220 RepID=UPI002953BE96|nr:NAD-dependent epimerase/dehydratase family protein [Rhodococcus sp. IEGM 1408]MDV8001367.1 NAD-dependent epimerase/dehydratase family protein [Rhodococcus sp. IEGM 1408]
MTDPAETDPGAEPRGGRPMRLVVTGASGNVGTALLRRLVADGHSVVGVCRRIPPATDPYDSAEWHSVDLSSASAADLVEVFHGADAVIHLAWGFQPTRDPDYHHRLGIGGTTAVVEACRLAGVPHLVHQSSVGVYAPVSDGGPGISERARVTEGAARGGVPTSVYNHDKAAAEELLDRHELDHPGTPTIARVRPGFIVHGEAASGLLRYFTPAVTPARFLRLLPVLPLDRRFAVPILHGDDMAEALALAATSGHEGAFNVAAEPPVTRQTLAREFGARPVHVPHRVLRLLVALSWRLHLQPLSPGWVDLAFAAPLMDTSRARDVLGWSPRVPADRALHEVVDGIVAGRSGSSAPLRRRTLRDALAGLRRGGPVDVRREP